MIEMLTGQLYLLTVIGLAIGSFVGLAGADVRRALHQTMPARDAPRAREYARRSRGEKL